RYQGRGTPEELPLQRQTGKCRFISEGVAAEGARADPSDSPSPRQQLCRGKDRPHVELAGLRSCPRRETPRPDRGSASGRTHQSRPLERSGGTLQGQAGGADLGERENGV